MKVKAKVFPSKKVVKYGLGAIMIGLLSYVILYAGKQAKLLVGTVIEYAGVKLNSLSWKNIHLTLFWKVLNISDITFSVQNQTWEIYLNNKLIKKLQNPNKVTVLAHSDTRLPIFLNFSGQEALNLGIANIESLVSKEARKKTKLKIKGVITIGTSVFDIKKIPVEFEDDLQKMIFRQKGNGK